MALQDTLDQLRKLVQGGAVATVTFPTTPAIALPVYAAGYAGGIFHTVGAGDGEREHLSPISKVELDPDTGDVVFTDTTSSAPFPITITIGDAAYHPEIAAWLPQWAAKCEQDPDYRLPGGLWYFGQAGEALTTDNHKPMAEAA